VRGFHQREGIDYFETFSPVARYDSARLLLAVAASKGYKLKEFDISTAFLSGELNETIFMEQPEEYVDEKYPEHVCKLHKAIYGLKQGPAQFHKKLRRELLNIGMNPTHSDSCVYTGKVGGMMVYLALYVDDGLLVSPSMEAIDKVIESLSRKFEVKHGKAIIFVGMSDAKPAATPMAVGTQLPKLDNQQKCDFQYREADGSLLFAAMVTRPDIANAVAQVLQHLCAFGNEHVAAVKRILRYLRGTMDIGLTYKAKEDINLLGFVDSDHAIDHATRRSTTGYIFEINGSVITWLSKQQSIVALSTCEAEFIAMAEAAKKALWLRTFMCELGFNKKTIQMYADNQGAIKFAGSDVHHRKTKHIDIRFRFIRDVIENGSLIVKYIPTRDNVADLLTKALPKNRFVSLRELMGLIACNHLEWEC